MYTWKRYDGAGYEVSTQGDKRFSALCATLSDGRTIEEAYQLDIKGYRVQGNNWRLGKGKPPLRKLSKAVLYREYKGLWARFLDENPALEKILRAQAKDRPLTDTFASSPVSQARALCELLNERCDHVWFEASDFTPEEIARRNILAVAVLESHVKTCKYCGHTVEAVCTVNP